MRFLLITMPLLACVSLSQAQGSGWIITLSNHRSIDGLTLIGVSGDSLRTVRNGVPIMFSINELAEIQEPPRSKLLYGALFGGIAGFVAGEAIFELAKDREEKSDPGTVILAFYPLDSYAHIALDIGGVLAGMTIGGLLGLTLEKDRVYEFRNLARGEKTHLLESILEDEEDP